MKRVLEYREFFVFLAIILSGLCFGISTRAAITDDINQKNSEIEEIQRQIEQYQQQIDSIQPTKATLQSEVASLNAKINQLNLEIKSLGLSITKTNLEVRSTQEKIKEAEDKIAKNQVILGQYLRLLYQNDQETLTSILLKHNVLSDFFSDLNNVKTTQDELRIAIDDIQALKASLEERGQELEDKQIDLERQKSLEEINKRSVGQNKVQKDKLLKDTKGKEAKFQELVKQGQRDLARLREEISFLLQGGLTLEDAVSYAKLAALGAGIRPAFLLALLEVESRLGKNVGTGNWQNDMVQCYIRISKLAVTASRKAYYINRSETEKNAFLVITNKLGLDPNSVKVSKEPSYGCGGAMGPAQFIPSTWLGYETEVIRITGHNPPNPWNFQDAFTASAIKLARGGATSKDRTGEIRAAKAYISGNSACASVTCNNYANTIQQKAVIIEQNL